MLDQYHDLREQKQAAAPIKKHHYHTGPTENEGGMITSCNPADDLRDAIIDYYVGTDIENSY